MRPRIVRFAALVTSIGLAGAAASTLGGCTVQGAEAGSPAPTGAPGARAAEPADSVTVLDSTDPAELALTASQTFFSSAPVVVLAAADDAGAQQTAEAAAVELAAPILLVGGSISDDGLRGELDRLGTVAIVDVREEDAPPGEQQEGGADGAGADTEDPTSGDAEEWASLGELDDVAQVRLDPDARTTSGDLDPRDLERVREELPRSGDPDVLTEVLVLTEPGDDEPAAVATARAAGAVPVAVPTGDPRANGDVVRAIASAKALAVVGIGTSFGTSSDLAWRLAAAESGDLLPNDTQLAFAGGTRYVVVHADAVTPGLVAVDDATVTDALDRARTAAGAYAETDPADPVVEVTASRASTMPGEDGDYSTEVPADQLGPFVDAATGDGVQVLLHVAPGAETFTDQIATYADVIARPGVGVVLDARGRYADGLPTGAVDPAEVSAAIGAVSGIVREHGLPQPLVVLQTTDPQSALEGVDAGAGEVALVVQQVGSGGYSARLAAWQGLATTLPDGVVAGWTTGSPDPALDVPGVLALDPAPSYVAGR